MLPKIKYHLKGNTPKNEMSLKLKCHQNLNVPKTKMLKYLFFNQEIGTESLGIVFFFG